MFSAATAYLPNDGIYTREKATRRARVSLLARLRAIPSYKVWIFNGVMLLIALLLYAAIGVVIRQTESGWLP